MKHKYLLLFFRFIQILIYLEIFFAPSVSSSQIIHIFPQVDTLSLWGTCTPPEFKCTLKHVSQDTDRIVIYPRTAQLICGIPFGNITAQYDSAYFEVQDSLQLNRYELFYSNFSIYDSVRIRVTFDSTMYSPAGPCRFTLRLLRNSVVIDSALLDFDSYQTGLGVGENNSIVPSKSCIIQNYPNPFNPSTLISYFVSSSGRVRIEVFDLLGNRVEILVNRFQQSGHYSFRWEPRALSSGTYFIMLTSGITRSVIKCQYLK